MGNLSFSLPTAVVGGKARGEEKEGLRLEASNAWKAEWASGTKDPHFSSEEEEAKSEKKKKKLVSESFVRASCFNTLTLHPFTPCGWAPNRTDSKSHGKPVQCSLGWSSRKRKAAQSKTSAISFLHQSRRGSMTCALETWPRPMALCCTSSAKLGWRITTVSRTAGSSGAMCQSSFRRACQGTLAVA